MAGDSDHKKLEALADRIKKAQESADPHAAARDESPHATYRRSIRMIRIGSDFVAVVVLSAAVGWVLDQQTGSAPLWMLVFLVAGFVAGFWMLARVLRVKPDPGPGERKE